MLEKYRDVGCHTKKREAEQRVDSTGILLNPWSKEGETEEEEEEKEPKEEKEEKGKEKENIQL